MTNLAFADGRREGRDEVHHRTRAVAPDGRQLTLLIVNISTNGMMARCEADLEPGTQVQLTLPVAGARIAEIRWSLGGRLGCQFEDPIALDVYDAMLPRMQGR